MSAFPVLDYRLMIVDDDEMAREVLGLLAERAGFAVEVCPSGAAALESLAARLEAGKKLPQGVLTDMQMPGVSGGTLALLARAACGDGAVILAMSASPVAAEQLRGYDGFLRKPFSMDEMCAALEGAGAEREVEVAEVLKLATLQQLSQAMAPKQLRELYRVCMTDAEVRLATLRRAAAAGDGGGWRTAAHQLKGSCAMVGASELAGLASGMEARGLPAVGEEAPFVEMVSAMERLRRILEVQLP